MENRSPGFHIADYVVFGITIVVSIGIGIYYSLAGGRQKTTTEYLVGGRSMKFLPVAISLMVSYESSIMMLGLPAEVYVYGIQVWWGIVGYTVAHLISVVIVIPLLHPLKITSAYEYLQYRFNSSAVRLLGSFIGILATTWYMGIVLFGPAIALEAVTGFSQWSSIFAIALVAVIYTSIGGLKAVIWTDVFQAFVMLAGMFAILIKCTIDVGSPTNVWETANAGGRLNFFNFDPDPRTRHTFWNLIFGSMVRGFGRCFDQSTVQRVSSTRTQREARWMFLITGPLFLVSLSLATYEGIVAYSYFETIGCDPLASEKITNPNQVIPFTVMDIFRDLPGMPGLFLASLFSACLSTLSSGLSSVSAILLTDFIKPRIGPVSELKATVIAKISVVVFGLLGCGVALLVSLIGGTLTQIATSLLAAFTGPLTGLFLMGCFCPWANSKGAFIGGTLSLLFSSWLSLGSAFTKKIKRQPWLPLASVAMCPANQNASFFNSATDYYYTTTFSYVMETTTVAPEYVPQGVEKMYTISYQWLAPIGILLTIILGSLISVITGGNKKGDVHPRYLISFCDHFCCFLPEFIRGPCRCGEDYTSVKDDALPPAHELYLDKEFIIDPAPIITVTREPPPNGGNISVIMLTEMKGQPLAGNDVKPGHPAQDIGEQNGGSNVNCSTMTAEDDGHVFKVNDGQKIKTEEEKKDKRE